MASSSGRPRNRDSLLFPNAERILKPEGRAPIRGGSLIYADQDETQSIGRVNSGGFGPSVNAPVAMGYVPTAFAASGTLLFADVRGQRLPMRAAELPFVPHSYKR